MLKKSIQKSQNKRNTKRKNFGRNMILNLLLLLLVVTGLSYLLFNYKKAEAGWFDESWHYRKIFTVSYTGSTALTEYQVLLELDTSTLVTAGKLQSDCDDIRFTNRSGDLLSYYIPHGCNTSSTKIWVKVDSIPSSTNVDVLMYYGNPAASVGQSETATFTYSTQKTIAYTLHNSVNELDFISYSDGNSITHNGTTINLKKYQTDTSTFDPSGTTVSQFGAIQAKGPFEAQDDDGDTDSVVPISWAGTDFIFYNRDSAENVYIWAIAPWGNATVSVYDSAGVLSGCNATTVSTTGSSLTCANASAGTIRVTSDLPIVAFTQPTNADDQHPLKPITTQSWLGGGSTSRVINGDTGSLDYRYYYDTNASEQDPSNLGSMSTTTLTGGSSYGGGALLVRSADSNTDFSVNQQGDGDGRDAHIFNDVSEQGTIFGSAYSTDYISVASTHPTTCTVYNQSDGSTVGSGTATSSNTSVYFLGLGTGDTNTYTAGAWYMECDKPAVVHWQKASDSEVNIMHTVLARQFTYPTPSVGTLSNEEIGKGPFAWYKFDEGNGTTAYDSSSSNINGTINGAAWRETSDCINGRCLQFDGTDDYVQMGDFYSDAFTVCAWVKPAQTGQLKNIVIKRNNSSNSASTNEWQFTVNANNTVTFSSWNGSGVSTLNLTSTQTLSTNVWSHVCAAQGGASATGYLYINAKQAASSTQGLALIDGSSVVQVGSLSAGDSTRYFKGFIDEVKIYPYQRTAGEVREDYLKRTASGGGNAQIGASNSMTDLSDGLVAYYPMSERAANGCVGGSNDTCDKSGNGNDLFWDTNDPTPTGLGKFGYALDFESSTSDYTYINDNSILSITSDMTLSAWIKLESAVSGGIITKDSGAAPTRSYYFNMQSNKLRFLLSENGTTIAYRDSNTALTTGIWYHVVAVYDSKRGLQDIYLNGALDNGVFTGTIPSSINDNNVPARIGYTPSAGYFDGVIDDARIYNRALSPTEVQSLYNFAPGPIGWWKFDDNTGTSSVDSSGNNYTLSSLNTNYWEPGKYGSSTSIAYGGSSTGWYLADNSAFESIGAITVEAWVKRKNAVDHQRLVGKYFFTGGTTNGSWILRFTSANLPRFEVSTNGTSFSSVNGTTALANDTWYHLAATYDGATMRIYVNGILEASTNRTGNIYNSDYCITFGYTADSVAGCGTSVQNPFQGNLDDVRIYDYARTQAQINEDMNNGAPAGAGTLSPVAWYKFEEGNGTTAYDSGVAGINGTLANMASPATSTSGWTDTGLIGKAINFDGSNDSISLGTSTKLKPTTELTLSGWFKLGDNGNRWAIADWTSGSCTSTASSYLLVPSYSGTGNRFFTFFCGGTTSASLDSGQLLTPGQWYHLATTFKSGVATSYVDGKQVAKSTLGVTSLNQSSQTVRIGSASDGTTSPYYGSMDEIKIFNYALSSSEIALDYNLGKAAVLGNTSTTSSGTVADNSHARSYCVPGDTSTCSAPVAEWKLDENTGTSTYDSSGNSNTGTLSSGPTWEAGKEGSAVGFDGNNDFILVSDSSSLDVSTALSISTWVYVNDDSLEMDYVSKWMTGGLGSYFFGHNGSGDLVLALSGDGSTYNDYTATHTFNTGEWVHLAATWNTTDDTAVIYQNGIPLTTTLSTGSSPSSLYDSSTGVNIGARYEGGYANFNGKIDTTRIYNYVRTPAQIAWEYNQGAPVLWYKMDECQGSTLNDSGSIGQNASLTVGGSGTHTSVGTCNTAGSVWGDGANGKNNASIDIDGTDEYVVISDNAALSPGDVDYSVATWFRTSKDYSSTGWIFSNYGSATANLVGLTVLSDEKLSCIIRDGSSNTVSFSGLGPVVSDGEWHHAVCMLSGNNAYLYVDGILRVTVDATSVGTINTTGRSKYVGSLGTTPGTQLFDGQIDDFKIYRYALSAAQVKSLYNDGAVSFR